MKYLPSQLVFLLKSAGEKRNIGFLYKFFLILFLLISLYSTLFHFIMEYEDRKFSWLSGLYWTFVTMTTLGFGDITFTSDLGKVFSVVVLLSGVILLLVMLPFTFIRFFYAPWLEAREKARAPRELPGGTAGHVIFTNTDPISLSLIAKLKQYHFPYVIICPDQQKASELYDANYKVVVGDLDRIETYRNLRVETAALVFVNNDDMLNTNIVSTIREYSEKVTIITNADAEESVDILELAGATDVFQFTKMLGMTLAQRAIGVSTRANIVGRFGNLLIGEAHASRTPFEGKTLIESRLREKTGINVIGMWQRGKFGIPHAQTRISSTTVLLLAGSEEQFKQYDSFTGVSRTFSAPVLILGGGRVGTAAAHTLSERGIEYRIVERHVKFVAKDDKYIVGSAADIRILERAGIYNAPSVFITTHDDDINIYLTIYCRKLRPDIQILSRATLDRNINKLYTAGADLVMSYASMGSNTVINILKPNEILMLTEGLNVFRIPVPQKLAGLSIAETGIREKTGCNVVAIHSDTAVHINPDPSLQLAIGDELIIIGTAEGERIFIETYAE